MLGGAGRSAARGRMSPACPWDGRKAEAAPGSPGHMSRRTTGRTRAVRGSALPGAGAGDRPRLRFLRGAWARLLQLQPPSLAPAPVATRPSPGILTSRFAEQVRVGVTGSPALHALQPPWGAHGSAPGSEVGACRPASLGGTPAPPCCPAEGERDSRCVPKSSRREVNPARGAFAPARPAENADGASLPP